MIWYLLKMHINLPNIGINHILPQQALIGVMILSIMIMSACGSDSSFQTTFGTVGQYSISLKACMGSECITDVQAIEVVASKQSSEGK